MYYPRIIIYFDGASKNNPRGPAGCGWCMEWRNNTWDVGGDVASGSDHLGYDVSNNQAEYEGLYSALNYMMKFNISCRGLYIRGDSQLVINQLSGNYQVRNNHLIGIYHAVCDLLDGANCSFIRLEHVDRSRNEYADYLAKGAANESNY